MSTEIELFTFDTIDIRTVEIDGVRCAVAADICRALEIKNVSDAVQRLDEADVATADIRSGGQIRRMVVVTEGGATDLVLDSRKPEARRFRRFLTHEVWPSIRDTGAYSTVPALTEDEIVHQALAITAKRVEELSARVAVLEPKAEVADKLLDAEGDLSVRDAAQSLTRAGVKTGERRLFAELNRRGWVRRAMGDGRYRVLQSAIESGYMSVLPQSHYHPKTGELVLDPPQPRVTPKGLQRLLADIGGEA
ncbi:phage antirepressor KilAC domain-containing protein [Mycobacterium yunnanensis]|uniref:Phage antirepressor KilAC domain-containing protein n=1 Tax=Mycobacterium yunnanensis TaxID=368477 RepID=A0A9X3C5D9_9MYCO|nr:phage antirepressor KilAC domain-containing protein [Mycobacterium yunnanensis]MCV7424387.1 phage antirepressor KilAC domain-containing protein [Mycobacterium yunnanensis]